MIQRIQSILLGVSIVVLVYFSIGASIISYTGNDISYLLKSNRLITSTESIQEVSSSTQYFFIGAIILALWSVFVLISFRNLSKQLTYARLGSFGYLIYLIIVLSTDLIGVSITDNPTVGEHSSHFQFGVYLLLIGYITYILTIRFIKKDKNLVESVDRIR